MGTKIRSLTLLLLGFAFIVAFTTPSPAKYKCMIQMTNYEGHGAYVVISLLDKEGNYVKTLYVQGDDDEWYFDITEWWNFYGKRRPDIDAITGATVSGGQRTISVIELDEAWINSGYRIRFETAVEDQDYHVSDVEFELTEENLSQKKEGKGFIRYVRMIPQ